jgi:hypothetical protein
VHVFHLSLFKALPPWSRVYCEELIVTQMVNKFLAFLQGSQEPTTRSCSESDKSGPHSHTLFISASIIIIFSFHLRLSLPSDSSFQVLRLKFRQHPFCSFVNETYGWTTVFSRCVYFYYCYCYCCIVKDLVRYCVPKTLSFGRISSLICGIFCDESTALFLKWRNGPLNRNSLDVAL